MHVYEYLVYSALSFCFLARNLKGKYIHNDRRRSDRDRARWQLAAGRTATKTSAVPNGRSTRLQQGKAHSSKACPCHWATCEPLSAPFGSAGACQFSRAGLVSSIGVARVCGRSWALLCAALIFSADQQGKAHTLAKHVHAIGQLVSHSRPLLGQLVHVNFLTQVSCRVLHVVKRTGVCVSGHGSSGAGRFVADLDVE